VTARKEPSRGLVPEGALQEKIADAMRALPFWVSNDFREEQIYTLTEKYIYMAFDRVHVAITLTPEQIKSELSKIEKQSRTLFERLMRSQWQITEALNSCMSPSNIGKLEHLLELLIASCAKATVPNSAKRHKGRDRKLIPLEVAKAAACDFHSLTGKKPICSTKRDGFPDFLSAVFKALNMSDDSVESFAKKASEWWHKERPNEVKEWLRETMLKPPRASEEGFIFSKPSGWHK
jgi:hypothetical protein